MVEAVDHCTLLPTSILDIYKVFYHLSMRDLVISAHPYTVIWMKLGQKFVILSDSDVEMMS
jgi:hypothetical protein